MTVTLVLADDHPIVRQGLRHLLESEPEFSIVGEAEDGIEALRLSERLQPHILLVDMMMPGLNGLEVLRQMRKLSPATRTIVLSMQSADGYVIEALKQGAAGYVLKDTGPGELINAVRQVNLGNQFLSAKFSKRFQDVGRSMDEASADVYDSLTAREREILQMTVEGLTSAQIGRKLMISPRTVDEHRANLTFKLGIKNPADLIRYAIKRGIIPLDL